MHEPPALRARMRDVAFSRWQNESGIRFHWITPAIIGHAGGVFQRQRRIYADTHANSDIYILADDDCLLGPTSPIEGMLHLMAQYPEFAILSLWPINANIGRWTPEDYSPIVNDDVFEHVSVGQVRFCRKPVLKDWPALTSNWYDNVQCEHIRKEGRRVGYAVQHKMIHLGEGYTSLR